MWRGFVFFKRVELSVADSLISQTIANCYKCDPNNRIAYISPIVVIFALFIIMALELSK